MRNMMKRTGLSVLALIVVIGAFAQDGPGRISFTLDEAQQYAIEHNRTLQNASLDVRKAQAARWQTIAGMDICIWPRSILYPIMLE